MSNFVCIKTHLDYILKWPNNINTFSLLFSSHFWKKEAEYRFHEHYNHEQWKFTRRTNWKSFYIQVDIKYNINIRDHIIQMENGPRFNETHIKVFAFDSNVQLFKKSLTYSYVHIMISLRAHLFFAFDINWSSPI